MSERLQLVRSRLAMPTSFVRQHHRHHGPTVSGLFAVAAGINGEVVGVAIIGRPSARMLQDGWTAEVTRLATDEPERLLERGCVARLPRSRYRRLVTYILAEESGTNLRPLDGGVSDKGRWLVVARYEAASRPASVAGKMRWEIGV